MYPSMYVRFKKFKPSETSENSNWNDDSDNLAPRTNYSLTTLTHWHGGHQPRCGGERVITKLGRGSSLELEQ